MVKRFGARLLSLRRRVSWHTLRQFRAIPAHVVRLARVPSWHAVCFIEGMRKPSQSRKLLIASIGVATISYVAACGGSSDPPTSGNLVSPPAAGAAGTVSGGASGAAGFPPTSGNLVAPPAAGAGGTVSGGGTAGVPPTSGNLVAPPAAGAGGAGAGAGSSGDAGASSAGEGGV